MYTFVVAYYTDHAGYSRASVFGVGEDGLRAKCIVRTKPKSVA